MITGRCTPVDHAGHCASMGKQDQVVQPMAVRLLVGVAKELVR